MAEREMRATGFCYSKLESKSRAGDGSEEFGVRGTICSDYGCWLRPGVHSKGIADCDHGSSVILIPFWKTDGREWDSAWKPLSTNQRQPVAPQ